MAETSTKVAETLQASGVVIESRSRTIATASSNPLAGDYNELGRMIPEKVAAFSQAGMAAFGDLQALQLEAVAQWQQMMGIAMRGRAATAAETAAMTTRSARMTRRATGAAAKALAPIHRTATGNAERLAKKE